MNQRALSQVGTPILIEDAMLYDELLKDNAALRVSNAALLETLKLIQVYPPEAVMFTSDQGWQPVYQRLATVAIEKEEGC